MVALTALWLPILVSAVLVFIASYLIWAVLPLHKADYKGLPDENTFLETMRKQTVSPGLYMFPFCKDPKEMNSPEITKKLEAGPVGMLVLRRPGKIMMGKSLLQWFLYNLIVSVFVAYLTGRTMHEGADYLAVFRVAGTSAILAYSGAIFSSAIWMGRPWSVVWKEFFDGVVYGLLTAGAFGWLWPR